MYGGAQTIFHLLPFASLDTTIHTLRFSYVRHLIQPRVCETNIGTYDPKAKGLCQLT